MKKVLFISYLLFVFVSASAQPFIIEWQNCFGGPGDEKAFDIVSTGDGYMILAYHSVENQGRNILLLRTDTSGNIVWEKSLGGTKTDEPCRIFSAGNGNYLITSVSTSSDGDITFDPYPSAMNYWILKVNGFGNILWEKIYGGTCIDQGNFATTTSDGGVIAYGYTCSPDGDITNHFGSFDAWMVKVDSMGSKIWDFTIGHNNGDFSNAIIETSDKGILATAGSYQAIGGNIECDYFSIYTEVVLFKLDSVANIEWQQCYGGGDDEWIDNIVETEDGFLLAGTTFSGDGDLAGSGYHLGYDNNGNHTSDIWLIKIDFTGNILWSKCYGGTRNEYANRVFKTEDGGFIVFGETSSYDGDVVGNHSSGPFYSDIWVIKINSLGDLIWQQCFGGNGSERLWAGVVDNGDGSFVIASTIYGYNSGQITCQTNVDGTQIWIIKIKDTTVVNTINREIPAFDLEVYPNPAKDYVLFELEKTLPSGTITISDITGRLVSTIALTDEKTVWQTAGVLPGVYLYRLQTPEGASSGKLLLVP